ncbi:MAG: FAD-binding oxidoreductase [Thermodesulfobacteriota bacterium]|nr:FAD-binding oxidoreductase [Thermodesulfobacteriota bacterium]
MSFPRSYKYVIVGAGIHGLSTAYHLARELKNKKSAGSGKDILVIDKTAIGAGASGIACGVIRNNYYQPAMQELIAHSVGLWEEDAEGYGYYPVGYMQISPESMHVDVAGIYDRQKEMGYPSVFIEGEKQCLAYMKENIFHDWQAKNITSILHEKKGGYAHNTRSLYRLADKAEAEGVRILTGVEVTGFKTSNDVVTAVQTPEGDVACESVVIGAGPWAKGFWDMLDLPKKIAVRGPDGEMHNGMKMWTYWCLEEGTLGVAPDLGMNNEGKMPPVIHVDSDAPLYSSEDGSLITDEMWGIYYKPDFHFKGIQGGSTPYIVEGEEVAVDPYGIDSPDFIAGPEFAHMWTSALAHCQKRYEDKYRYYKKEPSGGLGAFTPDNFPIFDRMKENCYMILDSNHGYKMIGVGQLVAKEVLGAEQALLKPFRFDRYAKGELHPVSNSPFPWS